MGSKRPSTGESLDLSGTAKNRHRVASLGSRLPVKRQRSEDVDSSQRMLQLQRRFVRSLRLRPLLKSVPAGLHSAGSKDSKSIATLSLSLAEP